MTLLTFIVNLIHEVASLTPVAFCATETWTKPLSLLSRDAHLYHLTLSNAQQNSKRPGLGRAVRISGKLNRSENEGHKSARRNHISHQACIISNLSGSLVASWQRCLFLLIGHTPPPSLATHYENVTKELMGVFYSQHLWFKLVHNFKIDMKF